MEVTKEWQKFNHKEGYEKVMQDVKLKSGVILYGCWPNAGIWNICYKQENKSNMKFDGISVNETDEVKKHKSEIEL